MKYQKFFNQDSISLSDIRNAKDKAIKRFHKQNYDSHLHKLIKFLALLSDPSIIESERKYKAIKQDALKYSIKHNL